MIIILIYELYQELQGFVWSFYIIIDQRSTDQLLTINVANGKLMPSIEK